LEVYDRNSVFELAFDGKEGDYFMLKKGDCNGARDTTGIVPGTQSFLTQLEPGGIATEKAMAYAMINELVDGEYKVCYATFSSEADSDLDFQDLSRTISIVETVAGNAVLRMETRDIGVGGEAIVYWESGRGYAASISSAIDWIGIYKKGDCAEPDLYSNEGANHVILNRIIEQDPTSRHQCYIEAVNLPAGESSGSLKFYMKEAGEYEARYFKGNTRDGGGYVCKRIMGSGANNYVQCVLTQAAISDPVMVSARNGPVSFSLEQNPGLEVINTPYMY